jgi:cytochrome c biogenesis protein CcdA
MGAWRRPFSRARPTVARPASRLRFRARFTAIFTLLGVTAYVAGGFLRDNLVLPAPDRRESC